tara:strand:+ start:51 stop:707 length:657 start_codon:yes stop_codon:yes gene_type:complete
MNKATYILIFFSIASALSQNPSEKINKKMIMILGDTITESSINLTEVIILPKLELKTSKDRRQYFILKRKTMKVYPYAKLASERLEALNERMAKLKSKRKKKQYAKKIQKFIEDEFSEKLKKFTITEGQILIKLIHRQTGETAYELIKKLRSGWRAFWYNNTAKIYDMSLKIPFDPLNSKEDFIIESILQRNFQNGQLDFQKSHFEYDLFKLSQKWKN